MYYVSVITEFPIYEPAEGGYYYAGEDVAECYSFSSFRKARQRYKKIAEKFKEWYSDEPERVHEFNCGGCNKYGNGSCIWYDSRYIGDGERVQITRYVPQYKGWQPYC